MQLHKPIRNLTASSIETTARHSAVAAVEERFEHQNRLARKAAFRAALRNYSAIALLLAIGGGVAYWLLSGGGDVRQAVEKAYTAAFPAEKAENEASPLVPAPYADSKPDASLGRKIVEAVAAKPDPTAAFRKRYAELTSAFQSKLQGHWKTAPEKIRPKNVPAGTVYHALVARRLSGYDIYEIVTGSDGKMTYGLLSPIAEPVRVKSADFKAACAPGYLIELNGVVYFGGRATDASAKKLQERLATVSGF